MYSYLVTKQTLDKLAPKLSFDLKPRSIAESKFYVQHFNSLLDDEGQLTRDLKPDEVAYIQSERILCKFDFRYWSPRYGAIPSSFDVPNGGAELRPRQFNLAAGIISSSLCRVFPLLAGSLRGWLSNEVIKIRVKCLVRNV